MVAIRILSADPHSTIVAVYQPALDGRTIKLMSKDMSTENCDLSLSLFLYFLFLVEPPFWCLLENVYQESSIYSVGHRSPIEKIGGVQGFD